MKREEMLQTGAKTYDWVDKRAEWFVPLLAAVLMTIGLITGNYVLAILPLVVLIGVFAIAGFFH